MGFKTRANFELSVFHFRFPSTCVAVVFLRRSFYIYDVNFLYNALSFLRSTLRSSVNHVFIIWKKHFLYLVVAKFPALVSQPFARFLFWAQGTENIKVLNHRFSYYWGKEYHSSCQEPCYIEVHEVVVLPLGWFLTTFSVHYLEGRTLSKNPPLPITHWNTREWNRRMRESAKERKRELTSWYCWHLEKVGKSYDYVIQGMI